MSNQQGETEHQLASEVDRALNVLKFLSKTVWEGNNPPSGAYAFFHHNAHAIAALQDCDRILRRLFSGRASLTVLAFQEERLRPDSFPAGVPLPDDLSNIMRQSQEITEYMKLDLESLYIFGGILLDQWALQAIAIGKIDCPKQHPFRELVDFLDTNSRSTLKPLWLVIKNEALWLYYQLRFYRNRFIVHANRPWQRGTTRSTFGDDFNLFTPTPPGWLDDAALDAAIRSLMHLAPAHIRNAPDDYWEKARPGRLIEVLMDHIASFEKSDRETISCLFGKKGGSTPDFKVLGKRLLNFVADGTEQLILVARENHGGIDLGAPHTTSDQMLRRAIDADD